ncbi:hypothetical protein [Estrella lausannensis]|uniref:Putative membrane protein n=1 Tax=Estrella lausannensis TaxID=483423 RepID=A0A0H5DPD9_9BACT|nr:hypothetical protein [Estrella lausannensis]CRX38411.1 putative membrane protein [Estrella lausannensis]
MVAVSRVSGSPLDSQVPVECRKKVEAESNLAVRVMNVFEKAIWDFINQTSKVLKQTMKIVIVKCPEYAERLSKVIAHIGFLAGVSLLLSIKSLPSQMANWYKNFPLEDLEGGILGTLDLFATLGGMLDDVSCFTGSLTAVGAIPAVAFFGAIGMPLAISLLSYAILSKSYSLVRHGQFIASLPKEINAENLEEFKKMIAERLDDPDAKLKAKKIRVLSRHADPKVTAIMEQLKVHLEKNPGDLEGVNLALNDMKVIMRRKMALGTVATVANGAMLTALVAGILCPPAAIAVSVVAAMKATTAIGSHAYKTFWFESNLTSMERMKSAA